LQPDGIRKAEHKIVAEKAIGRDLKPNEIVHHINHNRLDNNPKNLLVLTRSEHTRLHALERCEKGGDVIVNNSQNKIG
jgi:hypothetical protein